VTLNPSQSIGYLLFANLLFGGWAEFSFRDCYKDKQKNQIQNSIQLNSPKHIKKLHV